MKRATGLAAMAAAALLGMTATAAMAVPAETGAATKLRSGPGPGYRVLAALPRNAVVDIGSCVGAWCPATWRGITGYVGLASLVAVPPVVDPYADRWDTDTNDNWVRVRRNGQWVWVPPALDGRKARDDRNRNRRNAGNGRDDARRADASRGNGGGAVVWRPAGGSRNDGPSSMNAGGNNGGRDGGRGGRGGDGGGRGGGGDGGGGGNGGGGGGGRGGR